MRVRGLCVAVSALAVLLAQPAVAQVKNQPPSTLRSIELVKRLMIATGVEAMVDQLMTVFLPMIENSKDLQDLPPEGRAALVDTLREVMRDSFTPKLIREMTPAYAAAFTEVELEAIVAFYEGPLGIKMLRETPRLTRESARAAERLTPELEDELVRRLCQKIDCNTDARKS